MGRGVNLYQHECTLCPLGSHVWQRLHMLLCRFYAHPTLFELVSCLMLIIVILV